MGDDMSLTIYINYSYIIDGRADNRLESGFTEI